MTTFEKLDFVADSVNPILMVIAIIITIITGVKQGLRIGTVNISYLLLSIISVYAISGIDYKFKLWSSFNLDYSTHTALALSSTLFLIKTHRSLLVAWLFILLMYFILMVYQGYHSVLDIVTTTIVLVSALFFVYRALDRLFKKNNLIV